MVTACGYNPAPWIEPSWLSDKLNLRPINLVISWSPAIRSTRVKVAKPRSCSKNCRGGILFLDIHVERVEVQFQCRTINVRNQIQPLFAGVNKIRLKTIHRFQGNHP